MSHDRELQKYKGTVALITGGASGIGRALGEVLAAWGAHAVLADRQAELAGEVAETIRSCGGQASSAALDVRDFAAFEALAREVRSEHGRIDYLFNNAGLAVGGEVSRCRVEDWHKVLDVNLRGVIHGIHAVYPAMCEQGSGHIVNTASMAGLMPMPSGASYCASKHAVVGLSASLRIEAAPAGVRVSVLCPGAIRTPILAGGGKFGGMREEIPAEVQEKLWERLRPMDPGDFAVRTLAAVVRNRAIIIVPGRWRLFWWLARLSPWLSHHLHAQMFAASRKVLEEHGVRAGGG